eukprot:PhF_6_TR25156/c3_g1_i1/m.34663
MKCLTALTFCLFCVQIAYSQTTCDKYKQSVPSIEADLLSSWNGLNNPLLCLANSDMDTIAKGAKLGEIKEALERRQCYCRGGALPPPQDGSSTPVCTVNETCATLPACYYRRMVAIAELYGPYTFLSNSSYCREMTAKPINVGCLPAMCNASSPFLTCDSDTVGKLCSNVSSVPFCYWNDPASCGTFKSFLRAGSGINEFDMLKGEIGRILNMDSDDVMVLLTTSDTGYIGAPGMKPSDITNAIAGDQRFTTLYGGTQPPKDEGVCRAFRDKVMIDPVESSLGGFDTVSMMCMLNTSVSGAMMQLTGMKDASDKTECDCMGGQMVPRFNGGGGGGEGGEGGQGGEGGEGGEAECNVKYSCNSLPTCYLRTTATKVSYYSQYMFDTTQQNPNCQRMMTANFTSGCWMEVCMMNGMVIYEGCKKQSEDVCQQLESSAFAYWRNRSTHCGTFTSFLVPGTSRGDIDDLRKELGRILKTNASDIAVVITPSKVTYVSAAGMMGKDITSAIAGDALFQTKYGGTRAVTAAPTRTLCLNPKYTMGPQNPGATRAPANQTDLCVASSAKYDAAKYIEIKNYTSFNRCLCSGSPMNPVTYECVNQPTMETMPKTFECNGIWNAMFLQLISQWTIPTPQCQNLNPFATNVAEDQLNSCYQMMCTYFSASDDDLRRTCDPMRVIETKNKPCLRLTLSLQGTLSLQDQQALKQSYVSATKAFPGNVSTFVVAPGQMLLFDLSNNYAQMTALAGLLSKDPNLSKANIVSVTAEMAPIMTLPPTLAPSMPPSDKPNPSINPTAINPSDKPNPSINP